MEEILVIDDDKNVLQSTGDTLEQHGYHAHLVETPIDAFDLIQKNSIAFHAILLDWKLRCPIDGDLFFELIRYVLPDFKIPIIFVTAHDFASNYLMRLGAYDVLIKPLSDTQLIDAVERALNKKPSYDPHLKAPCELDSRELKKQELAKRIVRVVKTEKTWKAAAAKLHCSRVSLYKWLKLTGLHHFFIEKEP